MGSFYEWFKGSIVEEGIFVATFRVNHTKIYWSNCSFLDWGGIIDTRFISIVALDCDSFQTQRSFMSTFLFLNVSKNSVPHTDEVFASTTFTILY